MAGPSLIVQLGVSGLGTVQSAFTRVQGMAGSLGSGLKSIALQAGALLGVSAGLAGVASGLKQALDLGGHLSDMSARTGIAVKSLAILEQAFKDAGLGAESIGKSVAKMQDALVSAARGDAGPAAAFARLGLSAEQLFALDPEKQFAAIGKAISGLSDPAQRTAAAMDIFGRAGAELLTLFNDGSAFDVATQRVGGLADVMGRKASQFDAISDALGGISTKVTGLFAGLADSLSPELGQLANFINEIDLTPLGQKIGGFVALAIDEWRAGRFGELISLTIEAGFEAGGIAAQKAWEALRSTLASGRFWAGLADVAITAAMSITKSMANIAAELAAPVVAYLTWLADRWRFLFEGVWAGFKYVGALAINWVVDLLERRLSAMAESLHALTGGRTPKGPVTLGRVEVPKFNVTPPLSEEEAKSYANESRDRFKAMTGSFFDSGTAAARELLGTADANSLGAGSALKRLNDEINRSLASRVQHEEQATAAVKTSLPIVNSKAQLAELERAAKERLLEIETRRALIEGGFAITAAEKWRLKKASLEQEKAALQEIISTLRQRAALETDPAAREQMLNRADTYESKLSGANRGLGTLGPNPYSTSDQIQASITGLEDQFGATAQAIARSFTSVIGSAVDSVAQGIEGLIMGTMSWADALRNVARTMLTSIVQAISRMFAEWIAKRALAAVKNMLFSAQEGAADTAAKAPGAVLSSISSWGIAVAVGVAAIVAAMAAFGGFQSGGYTGDGPSSQVAGLVHRGEFVVPAPVVQRIGVDNLEALRSGIVPAAQSASGTPPVTNDFRVAMFDSRLDARKWAESQEAETWFVDVARRTSHRWSRA